MANYYTQFSCLLDTGSPEKAAQAMELFTRLRAEDEEADEPKFSGFDVLIVDEPGASALWIHDGDYGDIDGVIAFVLRLAEDLDLSGMWGFDWANICLSPRIDAFGGGAHVIDLTARKSVGWISTQEWLAVALAGGDLDDLEALAQ
ncbi:hypothetical protein [Paenirhodobacter populi]|uniref:Uncharacterized protein n=1 Tax=Paenirhodobacter populi TaxID=2306993 RepID=A0A443JRL2_9RHOB|nr:hypothetical protein [Sinirhodobacter populi]RWR23102.1 hypothetical protein D2T30_05640 [Sinirhodobacter populi]